jgi:two-component system sensor histidine kinase HydH
MLPVPSNKLKFIFASVVAVALIIIIIVTGRDASWYWVLPLVGAETLVITFILNLMYLNRFAKFKEGVESILTNSINRIPPQPGYLGRVAEMINELATNLYKTNSLLEQVFDNLPLAVASFDHAGKRIICNKAAAAIFNCPGKCGENGCLKKQNDPESPLYLLGRTLRKGEPVEEQNFKYYYPGGHKHLWVRTDIIRGVRDELLSGLLIAWDVTERNRMEAQLRQVEKLSLVGELAAGMAHEILNPLTTVRGLTQVISSRRQMGDELSKHTEIMLNEIDRINAIIKQLLLLAKPSNPALSMVDLSVELDAVCKLLEGIAELQHVIIEKDYKSNLPLIVIDAGRMKQVFLNLASNAVYAMPDGGRLQIKACYKEEEGRFEIIFKDNGKGIQKNDLKRIFDPFFSTREEGTGLGLAVSYQIVRSHGGNIYVASEPDRGSTFTVVLPPLNIEQTSKESNINHRAC